MGQAALYVDLPTPDMRWEIRQAALDNRCTVRDLVIRILATWLVDQGYRGRAPEPDSRGAAATRDPS